MKNIKTPFLILVLCLALSGFAHAQQQADTLKIFFAINQSNLNSKQADLLNKVIADTNLVSMEIYGYTDFLGSAAYNQQLSEKRSKAVYDYLVKKGVSKENITFVTGEGIHPNSAEENRQDLSDKGIQSHRLVQIVCSTTPQNISSNIAEKDLVKDNHIILRDIFFVGGSDEFRYEAYPALKELLAVMQKHRSLKIEIQGHICCHGDTGNDQDYNGIPLSLARAKAVYDYLAGRGISTSRIQFTGFGSSRKIYPRERTEQERTLNRRVEILILEK